MDRGVKEGHSLKVGGATLDAYKLWGHLRPPTYTH